MSRRRICPDDVLDAVAEVFKVDRWEILRTDSKTAGRMQPRTMFVHMLRELTPLSYPEIARFFGTQCHSTFIDANRRAKRWIIEQRPMWGTQQLAHELARQIPDAARRLSERPLPEMFERYRRERAEREVVSHLRRSA